jgi:hypothetical protein
MTRFYSSCEDVRTPWGMSRSAKRIGEGMTLYSTASHGGIKVESSLQKSMPEALRVPGGWYEEDGGKQGSECSFLTPCVGVG